MHAVSLEITVQHLLDPATCKLLDVGAPFAKEIIQHPDINPVGMHEMRGRIIRSPSVQPFIAAPIVTSTAAPATIHIATFAIARCEET